MTGMCRAEAFPEPDRIVSADQIGRSRAAAAARHISLGTSL